MICVWFYLKKKKVLLHFEKYIDISYCVKAFAHRFYAHALLVNVTCKHWRQAYNHQYILTCMSVCVCVSAPVIISVAQCSDRNGEWLPDRVQRILYHLSFMADSEPKKQKTKMLNSKKAVCIA